MTFIKILFLSIFSVTFVAVNAQTTIKIKDFSKKYYAKVIAVPDSYSIEVYDKATNKRLIKGHADQISESLLENDQLVPNVKELPYGDQSVLIYEDFNFDGVKDFAIMNGFQSCYSGPSFDIYLSVKEKFVFSESFSDLSNNYCGMFQVDNAKKRINVMTKSGCCWHQFSEFVVKNNKPVAVKVVEENVLVNSTPSFVEITTQEWPEGKEKQSTKLFMPYDSVTTVFSFKLKKNNKVVCLFSLDSVLYYALLRQDGSIEFSYPKPYLDEKQDVMVIDSLHYTPQQTTLAFKNKDVYYEVYEEDKKIGVRVKIRDNIVDLEGDPESIKGSLDTSLRNSNKNID